MGLTPEHIQQNLEDVQRTIAKAAERVGRSPDAIQLVAVTKAVGLDEIRALHALGIRHFGENRVQQAQGKIENGPHDIVWHMIGPIQRRKAKDVAAMFHRADAIDRESVAEALDKRIAEAEGPPMPVLVEVNVSGEESKHGFAPEALPEALEHMRHLPHVHVTGLMTMAPWMEDPETVRPFFAKLRTLAEQFELPEISMGMTNDYAIAIEEGATQVRIGSALFKE